MSKLKQEVKQLTLPLNVVNSSLNPEYAKIVKQNWKITFSKQYLTSVYAKRVMGFIASQIQKEGDIKEYYQITADKIVSETNLDKYEVYKRMKQVVREMAYIVYFIEDEKNNEIIPRHLLDTTRFEHPAGYKNGTLTVAFNPQLKGIINQFAHYSQYELNEYVNFSSWYSMRLFELLSSFKDTGIMDLGIEKYREYMGCGVKINKITDKPVINKKTGKPRYIKYSNHSMAIERTTREPLKEFKGTDLEFKVKPIYAEAAGRGRPAIARVQFILLHKQETNEKRIFDWIKRSKDFKRIYDRLKKYNVSDDVIVKYSQLIGQKKINELLYDWDLRQTNQQDRIKNTEHYCNKILKDIGQKLKSN